MFVFVFDMGGHGLNLSVVEMEDGIFETLASHRD